MDYELETRKRSNTFVKWSVAIPRMGISVESKSFQAYDYSWKLKLTAYCYNGDEQWLMTLYSDNKTAIKKPILFPLTVYIREKGKDIYLFVKEISGQDTQIWNCLYSSFRKKYPNIHVAGTRLQFVFDFHSGIPNHETINVEKSIQTSDPNIGTKCPENHPCLENLSLDLSKLVEGGIDTDVQLKCGDFSIGAHKMILGARSEVFRTMMQSDMVERREGIVEIIDMESKILNIFIKYIYTGNLPELTVDIALQIYEAADKYQVEALKKRSSQFLLKNLSPENALGILATVDAHTDSEFKDKLLPYIVKEKMPSRKVEWLKFCNEYPELAVEVLNFFYDLPNVSH